MENKVKKEEIIQQLDVINDKKTFQHIENIIAGKGKPSGNKMTEEDKAKIIEKIKSEKDITILNKIYGYINNRNRIWKNNKRSKIFFSITALLAGITLSVLIYHYHPNQDINKPTTQNKVDAFFYGFWTLIIPIWFLIEYCYCFPDHLKLDTEVKEDLKYTQELSSKFWVAFLLIISGILFCEFQKPETNSCNKDKPNGTDTTIIIHGKPMIFIKKPNSDIKQQ